ncbi:hypothetical protein [Merismopedia glauca]|uniref:Immunity protein 30 domain-containing protein n=1 Tax=Merismopedia glauca CCAP 1448/3 TaxID=1296344 RepID=A0A2T1C5X8_9CYAN|nr:hypothetical protein [Merismopedia glauca]PSB03685.1 hypothetical protein C7B64_07135 [Merismopedia glauca CCAP 1448/3]
MSNALLDTTLSTIAAERITGFDQSFELVNQLLEEYGEDNLAETLYAQIPLEYPWEIIADLFCILIWSTSDHGKALAETTQKWLLVGQEINKIKIALHLDVYPFADREQMEQVLSKIARLYPEVAARCDELITSRKELKE